MTTKPTPVDAYPLAWPTGWPRSKTRYTAAFGKVRKTPSPYNPQVMRATSQRLEVSDGLKRLRDELRRLGARTVTISSNLRLRQDGLPLGGQAKVLTDPGIAVYFTLSDGKPLVLACDRWNSAADNMAAIAGHIEAMRTQERYGVGNLSQAFAGYVALPAMGETQGGDWRAEFELPVGGLLTLDIVEDRYRALLRKRHPDAGGSHEAIVRLNRARDEARKYFGASA